MSECPTSQLSIKPDCYLTAYFPAEPRSIWIGHSLVLYIQKYMPCHFCFAFRSPDAPLLCWMLRLVHFSTFVQGSLLYPLLRNVKGFCGLKNFTRSEAIDPAYKTEGTKTWILCDILRTQTISVRLTPQGYMNLCLNHPSSDLEGLVKYLIKKLIIEPMWGSNYACSNCVC